MSLTVGVSVNGVPLDPGIVVADVVVRSGRERADDGLSPSSATIELLTPEPLGESLRIADSVQVTANSVARFTGRISELSLTTTGAGETATTLIAVGALARLPRLLVAMPLPAATAAARLTALFAGAGLPATIGGGTSYNLVSVGVAGDDPQTADAIVSSVMTDTGAIVADGGDGTIIVQFPEARLGGVRYTPDPARTSVEAAWEMSDDLANDVSIEYGAEGARATAHASNGVSIETYDLHASRLSGGLADISSATRRASSIVSRLAAPAWDVHDVETWDEAALTYVLGSMLTIAPLPASSPVGASWIGILEGWTERYQPDTLGGLIGVWDLAVGDPRHSAETLVWKNAAPAEHWSSVNPATNWGEVITNADL